LTNIAAFILLHAENAPARGVWEATVMNRTTTFFLALSCAALLAAVSNCGSSSPVSGGSAGASADPSGVAGIPVGNGTGTGGATGDAGSTGAAGAPVGNGGGAAGSNGGGTAGNGGGAAMCRQAAACPASGDMCTNQCTRGQETTCACIAPQGGNGRLEWACASVPCSNNDGGAGRNDGGAGGRNGGGNRDGGFTIPDGGFRIPDGGFTIPDSGITITDGGIVLAACPADVSNTAMCTANSVCATPCTNMQRRTCFCGRNGNWTCGQLRRCQ
jgi:hypothetical protein